MQTRLPDQVVVVVRADDHETRRVVQAAQRDLGLAVRELVVDRPGQVAALNAGLTAVTADITALTDDDAAPRPDWIAALLGHFTDPAVAGVGGRDRVVGVIQPERARVGLVAWYGRVVGNHHIGTGPARTVDILKGANMAFRTEWLRRFGFDERLRGNGAQVHNDLVLSLRVRNAGGLLVYDPAVLVDHHVAIRPAGDDRVNPAFRVLLDEAHNETLALLEYLPAARAFVYLAWAVVCGTRRKPGVVIAAALLPGGRTVTTEAFGATLAGRALGVASWARGLRVGYRRSLVHLPSRRNIRGVGIEIRAGLGTLEGWRSKARWTTDLFLLRLPSRLQGRRRQFVRTISLRDGTTLRYRLNHGDLQSIREVWLGETYRLPMELGPIHTIVDLGANIGLTSVYLAGRYDVVRLIAVEPVPANVLLLRQNLALNQIDGDVIEAVIGRDDGVARFQDLPESNLGHVSTEGRDVRSISMRTLLAHLGNADIDLLKIDIEGAERHLLTGDCSWLRRVRALMIEFHPPLVDSKQLAAIIESHGFLHIPAGSMRAHSTSTFVRA